MVFYQDGFTALAREDSNNDGKIDFQDDIWSDLLVWQDKNSNGRSDEGELLTMEEAGIASISLEKLAA